MKIKNKILMMAFTLIAFLSFGVINVNAATYTVTTPEDFSNRVFVNTGIKEPTIVKLGTDITLSNLTKNDLDNIYVKSNLTIDLNGQVLTLNASKFDLYYFGPYTVEFINSGSTGSIISDGSQPIFEYSLSYSYSSSEGTNLIFDGISWTKNDPTYNDIKVINTPNYGNQNLVIKNSNIETQKAFIYIANIGFDNYNVDIQSDVVIEPAVASDNFRMGQSSIKFSDFVDTTKNKVLVKSNQSGEYEEIDPSTYDAYDNRVYGFKVVSTEVTTHTVTTPEQLNERLFYTNAVTEETTVKLGADISTATINPSGNLDVRVGADLTIDLNGQTLTMDNRELCFLYEGPHTVKIIDTSESQTGKIVVTYLDWNGIEAEMLYGNTWDGTSKFILDGIDIEKTSAKSGLLLFSNSSEEANKFDVTIKNTNFKIYDQFSGWTTENNNFNLKIEPTTTFSTNDNTSYFRLSSGEGVLSDAYNNTNYKMMVKDTSSSAEYEIVDLSTVPRDKTFYSVRMVPRDGFEVTAPTFENASFGYSSISEQPISIKAVGVDRTIQSVTVDETDKFQVLGTGTPTVNAGNTNTEFTIKPKDGLDAGTHTATIRVSDGSKEYITTVTFVVNPAPVTHTVTTPKEENGIPGLMERLFYSGSINKPTIIKLGADISTETITETAGLGINVEADLTIDLNGQTLTLDADRDLSFWYYGPHTVKIIDSSAAGTGKIVVNRTYNDGIGLSIHDEDEWDGTSKFIVDGIDIEKTNNWYGIFRIWNSSEEANKFDITIKNTNFKIYDEAIKWDSPNNNLKISIEPTTTFSRNEYASSLRISTQIYAYSTLMDPAKSKVMVKDTSGEEEYELDPTTSPMNAGYYSIRIIPIDGFEVTAPTFSVETYGYSSISAQPISIKAIGDNRTIKSVTVDETDKFQVLGTGTPTVNAGNTNTEFTIKPKDGLSAGTHTATITVSDGINSYTTTVMFVVNKVKLTKPSFTSYTTPFNYDGNPKTVAVTGFDDTTMSQDGALTATDVGNYSLSYTIRDKNNYEWTDGTDTAVPLYWQITRASLTLGLTLADWTYKGTAATPALTGNTGNGAVTYEYKVKGADDSTYSTVVPTNAGEYTIRATVAETTNYLSATKTADFVINKKEISVDNSSYVENKIFDDSNVIDPSLIHITLSDTDALFTVTGTSATKYVGTGIGTNLVVTLTDDAYKNFTFASNSKTATITDKIQSIHSISRSFGNTTSNSGKLLLARGNSIDLGTLITPSDVDKNAVTYAITSGQTGTTLSGSTLSVANDGTLGVVKITATLPAIDKNDDGTNEYVLKTTTIYVDVVNKAVVTISGLTYNNRAYNGNAIEPTGTLTVSDNLVPASDLDVIYKGINGTTYNSTTAPTNVGKYEVIYSVKPTNLTYTGLVRYEFEITKANPSYIIPTDLNAVVGTQLHSITLPTGFTWETTNTTLTAGLENYLVKYTPSDTTNYKTITGINVSVYVNNKFSLTTSVNGGIGGTVSATKNNVVEGTEETITFTPNTGYRIAKVLVNNVETAVSGNSLELTMDKSYTVEVYYEKIPLTLDIKANPNATITPNGTETVYHGDSRNITINPKHGYELISVKVNNIEKLADMSGNTLSLTSITKNTTIEVKVAQITYNVIEGKNQNLNLEDGITSFRVKADGEYLEFSELLIDGTLVDGTLYDLTEGSTVITFNEDGLDFLKELSRGEHTLTFVYEDGGIATTNFTISDSNKESNPQTGDNIIMSIVIGLISLICLGSLVFVLKRKKITT